MANMISNGNNFSFALPLTVTGAVRTGKTNFIQKAIPNFARERRVFIISIAHDSAYSSLADKSVPVRFWLDDEKYRVPSDSRVTLIHFEWKLPTAEPLCELIDRIHNLSETEPSVLIIDSLDAVSRDTQSKVVSHAFQAQSQNLFCVLTASSESVFRFSDRDRQTVVTGGRFQRTARE